jgi:hypothetical protein
MRPRFQPTRPPTVLAALTGAAILSLVASADSLPPLRCAPADRTQISGIAAAAPASAVDWRAVTPAPRHLVQGPPAPAVAVSAPAGISGAPGMAGMVVGIDPETGKLGPPSRDFRARLSASPALDRSMTGLTVVIRPDGSKHLDLQGRFQDYIVVRVAPDGHKEEACVQGPEVGAALQGKPETRPSPEYEVR